MQGVHLAGFQHLILPGIMQIKLIKSVYSQVHSGTAIKMHPDPDYSDDKNRIIINKIRSSRKKPHLKYWFYAGGNEETADRDKDGIIDVVDDTRDLVELIKKKNVSAPQDIIYTEIKEGKHDYDSWSTVFPAFLIWADGK